MKCFQVKPVFVMIDVILQQVKGYKPSGCFGGLGCSLGFAGVGGAKEQRQ